jgi:hypothetical protein
MAFPFRLQHWHPISTAPCNRDVELRVADGTATSTLEFPCKQTNAGDWINSDFGTPIRIRPVEWRAWRYAHSLQPQPQPVKIKGRLGAPRRAPSAVRSSPQTVKPSDQSIRPIRPARPARPSRPVRRRNLAAVAYVLIGIVTTAAAAASLTQISARAFALGFMAPTPPAAGHVAAARHVAAASLPRAGDSCNDFGASFLNAACSSRPKKHVFRGAHRVATLVVGRPAAPQ